MNRAPFQRSLLLFVVVLVAAQAAQAAEPAKPKPVKEFPLDLAIIDPAGKDKQPPYIVMFPGGKDEDDRDVRRPLGRLEALRGQSKLFPESNKDPGLPVVMRGLRLHRLPSADGTLAGYEMELQGEFNAVRVPANKDEVARFLAGEPAQFSLRGEKNYGVYSYDSTTTIKLQLVGDGVVIRKLEGEFTFREGLRRYTSDPLSLEPPAGRDYLYRGERTELPNLPTL
ncbi:MAG: hypothetical protein L0211_00740 [Planctomycetaceae bacterium]|nr:hypothetical protein [Planctomycetaceae bacterium]